MAANIEENINYQKNDNKVIQVVHSYVFHAYQMEWQRTHDIENKATSIVGFVGVIFSLTIGSLSTFIVCADELVREKIFSSFIFSLILVLILALMILSIFYGIKALNVKNWGFFKATDFCDYTKSDYKKEKPTEVQLYNEMTDSFVELIKINDNLNKQISKYLNCSYKLFFSSLILLVIYFIHLIDISI